MREICRRPSQVKSSSCWDTQMICHLGLTSCIVSAELFNTERAHVRMLRVLDHVFYQKLSKEAILPPTDIKNIFTNLEEILQLHGIYTHKHTHIWKILYIYAQIHLRTTVKHLKGKLKLNCIRWIVHNDIYIAFFIFVVFHTHRHTLTARTSLSFEFQFQYWSKWQQFEREMSLQ